MAARIRDLDWASTPLGPVALWSDRLKLMVEQVLASPSVASLVCGPTRILIYNDAAARLYGRHHPAALGKPLPQTFPEGWVTVGPLYDRVFAGETVQVIEQPLDLAGAGPGSAMFDAVLVSIRDDTGNVVAAHMVGTDVTSRVQAAQALRESEGLCRVALEGGRMGTWKWDLGQRLVWGDAKFLALWGFPPSSDPLPLSLFTDRQSSEGGAQTASVVSKAIKVGEDFDAEIEVASGPNAGRWLRWRGRPSVDNTSILYGVTFDITEQKQAAAERTRATEAFRDSETRVRAVLSQAPMAIAFTGPEGQILFRNARFDQLWGREAHKTTARTYSEVYEGFHLDGRPIASDEWPGARAILKGETVRSEMLFIVNLRGLRVPCSFDAGPIRGADGQIIGAIVIFRDVTEELAAQRALRESEERLSQFGEASSDVLWIRDAQTFQWTYLTPAFETIYGIDRAKALSGDNMAGWVELIEPEDRERAVESLRRVRDGERVSFEYRIRRPSDGVVRWLRNTDFPLQSSGGKVHSIGGIGRDITDEKEIAERMDVLVAELQHRTRNLMSVVRAMSEKSMGRASDLADFRVRYSERLAALARVQSLLSRLVEGDRITFDALIRGELAALVGESSQVTLEGPQGVELRSSTVQTFSLALHELVTNAVKYGAFSQPGGRLDVGWRLDRDAKDGKPWLHVDWRERGVIMPDKEARPRGGGSGRELIERALPYQLKAKTTYVMEEDGVHCTIALVASDRSRAREKLHA